MTYQEAINELQERIDLYEKEYAGMIPEYYEALRMSVAALMERRLVEWIPVTERLPEKPEENPVFENKPLELYLVSIKNADYAFRAFWNGISFTDGWSKLDVIAWMPMPEPYKPEN